MKQIPQNLSFIWADEIVFEILTWLPIKSLMRFKCVSKAWNALIQHDSNFIKSHIARSHARPSAANILFELLILPPPFAKPPHGVPPKTHELEEFSLHPALHHYSDTDNGFPDTRFNVTICSNHCNGLVCFYKDIFRVYLHNVSTREIKPLPFPLVNCYSYTLKLFLGFDTVMETYKFLRFVHYKGRTKAEILTLGTNSWREIELIPELPSPNRYYIYSNCFYLNGLLYWRKTLDYFDFIEEKFGTLSPLEDSKNMKPTPLWEKLVQYSPLPKICEKRLLISDEVNNILMKYNSDDPNSKKVATLQLEEEQSGDEAYVLATASLIDAPASLVLPTRFVLLYISSFVENIIPLSFVDVQDLKIK